MANLIDYMDWRGDVTFPASEINEIDGLAFAQLAYVPFEEIIGDGKHNTIGELADVFFKKYTDDDVAKMPEIIKTGCVIFKKMAECDTMYAAYTDANNSRVFTDILSRALGDVLYTNDNGTTWYTDEACTVAPADTVDLSKYTTNLSGDAAVKKYSCYTKAQYDDLTTLSGKIAQ